MRLHDDGVPQVWGHPKMRRRLVAPTASSTVLPSANTAAMLFWALLAWGQITMRKVDGWQTLSQKKAFDSKHEVSSS